MRYLRLLTVGITALVCLAACSLFARVTFDQGEVLASLQSDFPEVVSVDMSSAELGIGSRRVYVYVSLSKSDVSPELLQATLDQIERYTYKGCTSVVTVFEDSQSESIDLSSSGQAIGLNEFQIGEKSLRFPIDDDGRIKR